MSLRWRPAEVVLGQYTPKKTPMNTTSPIQITEEGPKVDVDTALRPLDLALEKEAAAAGLIEDPDVARQRAINEATGSSILLPPPVIITPATWDTPGINPLEGAR
jgi:hypothetical protein